MVAMGGRAADGGEAVEGGWNQFATAELQDMADFGSIRQCASIGSQYGAVWRRILAVEQGEAVVVDVKRALRWRPWWIMTVVAQRPTIRCF